MKIVRAQNNITKTSTSGLFPALLLLLFFMYSAPVPAVELSPSKADQIRRGHQAGIRLGVWGNSGALHVINNGTSGFSYTADFNSASFYAEAYLGIRVLSPLMVEFAVGAVNRGDVTVTDNGKRYFGNISVYPVSARLRIFPFAGIRSPFQPYALVGGGLHIVKNNIQFSNDYYAQYRERSLTDLNGELGGGVEWPLLSKLALDLQVNHLWTSLSKSLFGVSDFSGTTVTVGIKWLLPTLKSKQKHGR